MSASTMVSTKTPNVVTHLPKFVDHADLHGRWAYKRLFGARDEGDSSCQDSDRTLRQFNRMHFCARQMKRLSHRYGRHAARRADYKRYALLHQQFRDQIASENLGLVYSLYKGTRIRNVDGDELLSEGMMALTRAIDTFDPWRGFRFSTYACYAIIRSFYRAGLRESRRHQHEPVSFDSERERARWLETQRAEESVLYAERLGAMLTSRTVQLTALERRILSRRFPMRAGVQGRTLANIGDELGLSKERVRQIQNSALAKLRKALETDSVLSGAVA